MVVVVVPHTVVKLNWLLPPNETHSIGPPVPNWAFIWKFLVLRSYSYPDPTDIVIVEPEWDKDSSGWLMPLVVSVKGPLKIIEQHSWFVTGYEIEKDGVSVSSV